MKRAAALIACALALTLGGTAQAAAPSANLTQTFFGPDENSGYEFCSIEVVYEWAGFKNAAFLEVYLYDETLGVAYGIGYDGDGNKLPSPLDPGQNAASFGTLVYVGNTVQMHADLLSKTGKVIARTVTSLPSIVDASCPDPV